MLIVYRSSDESFCVLAKKEKIFLKDYFGKENGRYCYDEEEVPKKYRLEEDTAVYKGSCLFSREVVKSGVTHIKACVVFD